MCLRNVADEAGVCRSSESASCGNGIGGQGGINFYFFRLKSLARLTLKLMYKRDMMCTPVHIKIIRDFLYCFGDIEMVINRVNNRKCILSS